MKRSRSTMELEISPSVCSLRSANAKAFARGKASPSETSNPQGLIISPVLFLKCECCGKSVMEYKLCGGNMIYCSIDCQEVLILSQKNGYLDQNK